jgi:hypothetical protein
MQCPKIRPSTPKRVLFRSSAGRAQRYRRPPGNYRGHGGFRIETNITVTTSDADIEAFHRVGSEQVRNLPDHMETLIIPAGSRNSAVSVLYGLHR